MTRTWFFTGFCLVGLLTGVVAGFQAPGQVPRIVEAERVRENLFVLRGGGGNTAVFIGSAGVTVVDTKNPGWGQPILDKIRELTPKPVVRIINTHTHGDHVSGNVEFPTAVDVVTHANTKTNMEKMAPATGLNQAPAPNIFTANGGRGMAKRTFTERLSIDSGADAIELRYFGRGHTNGDAWVIFPALRVMHAGDIFSGKTAPLLDANNGGSGVEIGTALGKAAESVTNVDTIITGHGPQMTMADLREYSEFNKDFLAYVSAGLKAGKSVEAIAAEYTVPARFGGYQAAEARVKSNVQVIANELGPR